MNRFHRNTALTLILLLGAARFAKWDASICGDEAYMLRHYASQPISFIKSHYEVPNNHILLSIILHEIDRHWPKKLISTLADMGPLQLPSILASIGALILQLLVALQFFPPPVALLSLTVLGVSFWHLIFSHMLRAYSMSVFFNLLNIYLVQQLFLRRRYWVIVLLPPSIMATHYLLPANVYFTAALLVFTAFIMRQEWSLARRVLNRWKRRQMEILAGRNLGHKKAAQKTSKIVNAFENMERTQSWLSLRLLLILGAVLVAGLGLTLYAYLPIAQQVINATRTNMTYADSLRATGSRLSELLGVLGSGYPFRVFWLTAALGGGYFVCRRRKRWASFGILSLAYLLLPIAASTYQRNVPPTRIYVSALPIWAMLFAVGLYGWLLLPLKKKLRLDSRKFKAVLIAAIIMVAGAASGQVRSFLNWNQGISLRRVMCDIVPQTRTHDDFAVILSYRNSPAFYDTISWEYYGFAANMWPYEQTHNDHDYDYLIRRNYFIVAQNERDARSSMASTRIDRFLRKTFRESGRSGAMVIYKVTLDDYVLRAYRRALITPGSPREARVEALDGLGSEAIKTGNLKEAVRWLSEARRLSPADNKTRFLLALALYLLGEPQAEGEFEWLLAHDPRNAHARLYYADTLADRGQLQRADRWYAWYFGPEQLAESWFLQERARAALESLRSGHGHVAPDLTRPERCLATARAYVTRGSYERAALALSRIAAFRPMTAAELAELSGIYILLHRYAEAADLLHQALELGAGPEARLQLANALMLRYAIPEALETILPLLKAYPNNEMILRFSQYLRRMPVVATR